MLIEDKQRIDLENVVKERDVPRTAAVIVLFVMAFLYGLLVAMHWNEAYIDFGDGNYLYISSRLADGLVLYRDIMAPQPPCHLYVGSFLIRLGRAIGHPLYTVRLFTLLLHLATMLAIYLVAKKLFGKRLEGLVAAFLYLVIPVGFWWSQGYQSEGLLIFFLLTSFYFYIDGIRSKTVGEPSTGEGKNTRFSLPMLLASFLGSLAAFTNMTAVPYLFFNNLFLFVRKRRLMLTYTLSMIVFGILGVFFMEIVTDGHYLENVFSNQVGTFPNPKITNESVLDYAFGKIVNEGKDIMTWEGGYVLFGLAGLVLFLLKGKQVDRRREYAGWYAFFALCSIIFVSKGGTMEYIFTIGEPFVVLFFACLIGRFWRGPLQGGAVFREFPWSDLSRVSAFLALVFLLLANFYIGAFYIRNTLAGVNYELSHRGIQIVKEIVENHTEPGDVILSPPYYAFITGRRVVEEYSENYIWTIKYINEVYVDKKPGEGVRKALAIAEKMKKKEIPLVLLDMSQTARLNPIKIQIEENYKPLNVFKDSHILQTLNTQIGFYVPK